MASATSTALTWLFAFGPFNVGGADMFRVHFHHFARDSLKFSDWICYFSSCAALFALLDFKTQLFSISHDGMHLPAVVTGCLFSCLSGLYWWNRLGSLDRFFFNEVPPVLCSNIYHRLNSRPAIVIKLQYIHPLSRTLYHFISCSLSAESSFLSNLALIWYFDSAIKASCQWAGITGQLSIVWLTF